MKKKVGKAKDKFSTNSILKKINLTKIIKKKTCRGNTIAKQKPCK